MPAHVPRAHFVVGRATWEVSLPVNPRVSEWDKGSEGVRVETVAVRGSTRLEIRFGDARQAVTLLDGMIRHHLTVTHSYMVDALASLLLNKFRDPAAAVLGGLTLHRLGRIPDREIWVDDLAREYSWIPDGRILQAALLMFDEEAEERAAGLEILLDATLDRPLYTDGLSLANALLHRWPDVEDRTPLVDRLDGLADLSAAADWRAVALTTRTDPGVWA